MKQSTPSKQKEWRCPTCGTLLGVAENGRIVIRYKSAAFAVVGELTTRCRRCNTPNRFITGNSNYHMCSA